MAKVHLVGSVGLDSPEEVFATVGALLRPYVKRVPDGEPGGRRLWISWQVPVLRANPWLAPAGPPNAFGLQLIPLRLADGVEPTEVHFGELGYAREARASYEDFLHARREGMLPPSVRFQVSLPTPYAVITAFCTPEDSSQILPAYERAMLREVERLCEAIPHRDLAVQWDVCSEMVQWDGRAPGAFRFPEIEQVFGSTLGRLSQAVPADVELGFHLCYGDLDAKHAVLPLDARMMVGLANLILASAGRSVTYVHLPVPADRDDDAFYAPLRELRLSAATELYLGLVHVVDGVEGTRRRMGVARKFAPEFGIASECGISRGRTPDVAREFLRVSAGAAEAGPA